MQSVKVIWVAVTNPFLLCIAQEDELDVIPFYPPEEPFLYYIGHLHLKRDWNMKAGNHIKWLNVSSTFTGT